MRDLKFLLIILLGAMLSAGVATLATSWESTAFLEVPIFVLSTVGLTVYAVREITQLNNLIVEAPNNADHEPDPHEQLNNNPPIPSHTPIPQILESKKQPTPTNEEILTALGYNHIGTEQETQPKPRPKTKESSSKSEVEMLEFKKVPREFICPLLMQIMDNPVVLCPSGHTIDERATGLLAKKNEQELCPLSREVITGNAPNRLIKSMIDDFMKPYRDEYNLLHPTHSDNKSTNVSTIASSASSSSEISSATSSSSVSFSSSSQETASHNSYQGLFSSNTSTTYSSETTRLIADMDDVESDFDSENKNTSSLRRRTNT